MAEGTNETVDATPVLEAQQSLLPQVEIDKEGLEFARELAEASVLQARKRGRSTVTAADVQIAARDVQAKRSLERKAKTVIEICPSIDKEGATRLLAALAKSDDAAMGPR